MRTTRLVLAVAIHFSIMAACAKSTTTKPLETMTPRASPTANHIATATMSPFPIAPTPMLEAAVLYQFLFSDTPSPDCALPCWQGLIIGESTSDDVFNAFETVFSLDSSLHPPEDIDFELQQLEVIAYGWSDAKFPDTQWFRIQAWIQSETGLLQGLFFYWSISENEDATNVSPEISPLRIIGALGVPSQIYASAEGGGTLGRFQLLIVYESGMTFYQTGPLEISHSQVGDTLRATSELCFDKEFGGHVKIGPPLDPQSRITTPFQEWQYDSIESLSLTPIDESLGITVEEFTTLLLVEDSPCLPIEFVE